MEKVQVLETPETKRLCISGCDGYIEQIRDGILYVIVKDPFDGGLAGPFQLHEKDVQKQEK